MRWLRRLLADRDTRRVPIAEPLEPRLLYSADVAAGLVLADSTATAAPEVRTLTDSGEYASVAATTTQATATYTSAALAFQAGQAGSGVDYSAYGSGYGIALAGGNAQLALVTDQGVQSVTLTLQGANQAAAQGEDLQAGVGNTIVGSDPAQWQTGIANYGAVRYANVYAGVDVRYYGTQNQLEYDFIVAPGADASAIRLQFQGTSGATVDADGNLVLQVSGSTGTVTFKAPVAYQVGADGQLQAVSSRYEVQSDGSVGFVLGAYDASRELVIDPVLDYATYLGDSGAETATAVTTDAAGNVYVTGRTSAVNASTAPFAAVIGAGGGAADMYVAKFSADLSTLLWSTRIGGSNDEQANAIAVDANGNVAVTGWTKSTNFPTLNAAQGSIAGGQDAVVFKLNASGGLVFSTFVGGSGATDSGNGVGFDSAGNLYAVGEESTSGLLSSVLQLVFGNSDNAYVNKYGATGTLAWSQLLGGSSTDAATAVAVDASGNAYVVGNTQSSNMSVTGGQQTSLSGASDAFLVRLDASGNTVYSTYVGGSDADSANGVAIDGSGKAYMVGTTRARSSVVFTTTAGAFMTSSPANNKDTGFLRVYDTNQTGSASLVYSSYLGGSGSDLPSGIAYANGKVVIVGLAGSTNFPVTTDAAQATNLGSSMYLVVLDPSASGSAALLYGTYYGATMTAGGVAVAGSTAYFVGGSGATGYATSGSYQANKSGGTDGLIVALDLFSNTAPTLAGVVQPAAILEDSGGGAGFLVSSLVANEIADADRGAQQGIAIIASDNSNGTWQYSLDNGSTWVAVGATSATSALLLAADGQTRLRFVPGADYAGTVAAGLTIRAWDRTSGTAGSRVDASASGGLTAFSSASFAVNQVVTGVNDAPVRTAGAVADVATNEDTAASLGLGGLQYGPGGGADEAGQALTITVTAVPPAALGNVVLADGTTVVTTGTVLTLADLRGLTFQPAANASGAGVLSWTVSDNGGTANGGKDTLAEALHLTVNPVNDPPVLLAGAVSDLTVAEGSPLTSLGLAGLGYGPGGGGDEATQALSYQVTAVPSSAVGRIVLADGTTTVVAGGSYTLAQIQGMQFLAANVAGGSGTFSFTVKDDGGTANGGNDTLAQSLTITVANQAPTLDGLNAMTLAEDPVANNGVLVADLVGGHVGDPLGGQGVAIVGASDPHGTWQYSLDGGTTWTAIAGVSNTQALLLGVDGSTRVRFVPQADWNGTAGGLTVRAWDQSTGTAGQLADATANGGATAFSAQVQVASVTVTPVNDAPVLTAGSVTNVTVRAGATSSLGLADLAYGPGGGADEAGQVLTFTIAAIPPASFGTVLLANGTAVVAGGSYTLAQIQGLQFAPAGSVSSGSASFSFTVQDDGGTANGGSDTLVQSLTITVANQAPELLGANPLPTVLEDAAGNNGLLIADLVKDQISDARDGIAVVGAANANGQWQYSRDNGATWQAFTGVGTTTATLLAADGLDRVRFVPTANWNGTAGGLVFRAWDGSGGTAGATTGDTTVVGGSSPFSVATAEAQVTVLAVNDAPVRTAGAMSNVTVSEDSGSSSLGLGGLAYGPGGGQDEQGQQLSFTVTAVPATALGVVTLADGTTAVVAGGSYTLAQIQGMRFTAAADANGTATFSFQVNDGGGRDNGGNDTLTESLQVTVTPVNDAPVRTAGTVANLAVPEDSGATSLGLGGLAYGPGGGADEAGQGLTYTVTVLPPAALGQVTLADGTAVSAGNYTLAQVQGMRFLAAANANGSGTFAFTVHDNGGTANGGADTLAQSLQITVGAVNDAPVLQSGALGNLTVAEGAPATSLGLAGLAYGPGGGADEAGQSLTYQVTAVPGSAVGRIVLADGTTAVVAGNSYTLAQIQGMQFIAAASGNGSGTFAFTVKDSGGTANGGSDTLAQALTVTVVNQAPTLTGLNAMSLLEDSAGNDGMLVADLVNGYVTDPLNVGGVAITAASDPNGSWEYSVDGGGTWTAIAGVSDSHALLLGADGNTRVRFVPAPDFAGNAGGLTLRAWDQSSGAVGGYADTTSNGGTTAFSAQAQTADVTVMPVNDAPVLVYGGLTDLAVSEGSSTSLGLAGVSYAPGGGADEAGQQLTYTVNVVPPAAFGSIQLADGTVVAAGSTYTLADIEGMKFVVAPGVTSGSAAFSFTVRDDGGTANGGADSLVQSMNLTVRNQAPVLSGSNAMPTLTEDATSNNGMLVADLVSGQISDPGASYGIAVIQATQANGTWQYSRDNGATWQAFGGVGTTTAALLAADTQDRIRFVPAANWNGTAGGLVFRAWDGSGGTAGAATGDTSTTGGSSAYSTQTAEAKVAVLAVNDAPVRNAGNVVDVGVVAGSGSTTLGLGALAYGPGGGADEATQALSYTITALPPATLGIVTLADGTAVTTGSYTLAQIQGMRFVAAASASGTASFAFQVRDSGGSANGGSDTLVQTLQVSVTPVAPTDPVIVPPVVAAPAPSAPAPAPAPSIPVVAAPAPPAPAPGASTDTRGTRSGGTLQDALGPSMPTPIATFNSTDVSFTPGATRLVFESDNSHALHTVVFDRDGLDLLSGTPDAQLVLARFGMASGGDNARLDDFQRTLRSAAFAGQLDQLRESVRHDLDLDKSLSISVVSVSLGLSVVYVLWLIRGGVLLGSYLSALPAWRLLDPLPVLARFGDEDDDEEPLEGGRRDGRDTLRGFG